MEDSSAVAGLGSYGESFESAGAASSKVGSRSGQGGAGSARAHPRACACDAYAARVCAARPCCVRAPKASTRLGSARRGRLLPDALRACRSRP